MQDDSAAPVAASQEPAADTVMFAVERYAPPAGTKPAAWMVVSWQLAEPYSHMRVLLGYVEDTGIAGEYRVISHARHGLTVAHYTAKPRTEWEIEGSEPPIPGAAES
jgi:hypothetical protein